MKRLLLFLCAALSLIANEPLKLKYTISPAEDKLAIDLTFQGNASGISNLVLPNCWAGQENFQNDVSDLSCNCAMKDTDVSFIKELKYTPNETVSVHYKFRNVTDKENNVSWFYRPIIESSHFSFIGYCLLALPTMNNGYDAHVTLEWRDFPEEWMVANSFGINQATQECTLPLHQLQSAIYVGGDYNLIENENVTIAIRGNWSFSKKKLSDLCERIVDYQRSFWNDYNFPPYFISIISAESSPYQGGTALTNSFTLFLNDTKESDEMWKWIAWLISHEHFHMWNGHKICSGESEGSMYWFSEGFTEYYALKLCHDAGILNEAEYNKEIEDRLTEYYTSPVHNEPNERICRDFWNDCDVDKLPYVRGLALALLWDQKIRERSNGTHCLDNFMFDLLDLVKKEGRFYSKDDLIKLIENYLPNEGSLDIEKYIIGGETIPLEHTNFC